MRFRTTVAAFVLAGAATLPLSGIALASIFRNGRTVIFGQA